MENRMEQYLSPYRLLRSIYNPNLEKEKEDLLNELSDKGSKDLIIDGHSYSRKAIEKAFQSLNNKEQFDYHRIIFLNKELLNFLENKQGGYTRLLSALRWSVMDSKLKEFILPYFAFSFQKFIKDAIYDVNVENLKSYIQFDVFLTDRYKEDSNQVICKVFDEIIERLSSIRNGESKNHTYLEIEKYQSENFLSCFDYLSDEIQFKKSVIQKELLKFDELIQPSNSELEGFNSEDNLKDSDSIEVEISKNQENNQSRGSKRRNVLLITVSISVVVVIVLVFLLRPGQVEFIDNSDFELESGGKSNLISVAELSKSLGQYYKPYSNTELVRYYYAARYNELIEQTPESQIKRRDVTRSKPYQRLLGQDEIVDADSIRDSNKVYFSLSNESEFDAVLFFVRDGSKIAAHSYIYSEDDKLLTFSIGKNSKNVSYEIYAYVGKYWNDFYRIRVGDKGLNGMFEFQPECYAGLTYTGFKINSQNRNGDNPIKILISEVEDECPMQISIIRHN